MEMLAVLASMKRLVLRMSWVQFENCITIIHLKAIPLCSSCFYFPLKVVRQKANMLTVDCAVWQVNKERKKEIPCWKTSFTCWGVVWQGSLFMHHVCGWQNQGEEQLRCCWCWACFVSCIALLFTCGLCWMAARASRAITTSTDSHVSILLLIQLSRSMGESCFVIVSHCEVCLWYPPHPFLLPSLYISTFETLTCVFSFSQFYLRYSASVYLCICLSLVFEWGLMVTGTLVWIQQKKARRVGVLAITSIPEDFPCLFYFML